MVSRHFLLRQGSLLAVLAVVGCGTNAPPVAETPTPTVSVSQPVVQNVIDEDEYEGRIKALNTQEVRARVRGYLDKVAFKDGQVVKAGDLLYEIDPKPYQVSLDAAKAQEKAAQATLEHAKTEFERTRYLVSQNAASRQELDVRQAQVAVDAANVLKAQASVKDAQLNLDFTRITAKYSGKMGPTLVDAGNLVNAGGGDTLLATLVTVNPMYVVFSVDERALLRYRMERLKDKGGQKDAKEGKERPSLRDLHIPVYVALEGEKDFTHKGEIDSADNRLTQSTGTFEVRAILPNPKGLLEDGMRARVRIPVGEAHPALLITDRAIGTEQARKFVYVVNTDDVVERRYVKLGAVHQGLQVVLSGLEPTDRVIVNGIQRVRDGDKVKPNPIAMPGAPAEPAKQADKK
jgi:RND family efflux transporter MFP subunit